MFLVFLAASAGQSSPPTVPAVIPPPTTDKLGNWNPAIGYVTPGQDEPGYRAWYFAVPERAAKVREFNNYLVSAGVGGVVPTWQLLRTASDWQRCGAQPYALAPPEYWPNVVQALRFIRDEVIPAIGRVEAVSAYREPLLNACAGGAPESAHRFFQGFDMVPLMPTTRELLIRELCRIHAADGARFGVGLGFYAFLRFHIDGRKFRKWGAGSGPEAAACNAEPLSRPSSPTDPTLPAILGPPSLNLPPPPASQSPGG